MTGVSVWVFGLGWTLTSIGYLGLAQMYSRGEKPVKWGVSSCIRALWCRLGTTLSLVWPSCSGRPSASPAQCLLYALLNIQVIMIWILTNSGATSSLYRFLQANFRYYSLFSLHLSCLFLLQPWHPSPLSFLHQVLLLYPPTPSYRPPFPSSKLYFLTAFRSNTFSSFTKFSCFSA